MYSGIREVTLTDEHMAQFYEFQANIFDLLINEYLIIRNSANEVVDKLRWDGSKFIKLSFAKIKEFKPKSYKQECCFDLIYNKNIPIKIIAGVAGSGKSKIAIKHGLHYLEKQWVDRIFIIRHNVAIGEKNGFLKGTKEEKILPWLGCIKDNLDDTQLTLEDMVGKGIVEVEGIEYIKGRDIKKSWIIVEECEDLTEEQFKVVGERASEGSYICFVGDYEQTSQDKYKNSSGLKRAIDKFKDFDLAGIIVFDDKQHDNVRSAVSKAFTYRY